MSLNVFRSVLRRTSTNNNTFHNILCRHHSHQYRSLASLSRASQCTTKITSPPTTQHFFHSSSLTAQDTESAPAQEGVTNLHREPVYSRRNVDFYDPDESINLEPLHPSIVVDHPMEENAASPEHELTQDTLFAIVDINNQQHKVIKDDVVMVNKLPHDIGTELVFDKVLLVGGATSTVIGRPIVATARVHAVVEEQTRLEKLRVFKMRRRKASSKKTKGHRSFVSILRITDVVYEEAEEAVFDYPALKE